MDAAAPYVASARAPKSAEIPQTSQHDVTVRPAHVADARELEVLAKLDSAPRLEGEVIVAECEGRIVAAMPLDGGRAIADPFVRTVAFVQLLEVRAQQLRVATASREPNLTNRLRTLHTRMAVRVN